MQKRPSEEAAEPTMSSVFPDWDKFAVHQRRPRSGCIPTGYEMLLRAAGATDIDFASFQDDFDLDKDLEPGGCPRNNFESVAAQIRTKYPRVSFRHTAFNTGAEKLAFLEDRLANRQPVLVSIALQPFGGQGWHIMPVVDASNHHLVLLKAVSSCGTPETCAVLKAEFARIHDQCDGGKDVAYLEEWQ